MIMSKEREYLHNISIPIPERIGNRKLFSDVEWSVLSWLSKHPTDVSELTVSDLSRKTFVSAGSIVRLAKKLGYDGFRSFKLAMIRDLESQKYTNTSVNFSVPFDTNSSAQSIINSMSSLYRESIDIAQSSLDAGQLERITDHILNSRRLILFGIGDSYITCTSFVNKLIKIGILAYSAEQYSDAECIVDAMTADDLGFFVTYSGQNPSLNRFGQNLKNRSIPFVTLTANTDSPLARISRETILLRDMEGALKDDKVATFYSQLVFSFILNSIYSLLYSRIR